MKVVVLSIILMAFATKVQANIVLMPEAMYFYASPTAKVDNYILQHQRQFEEQVRSWENILENFRKTCEVRLKVIDDYETLATIKLRDLNDKLQPLEMLGDINDICVEKYRNKLPLQNSLRTNMKGCIIKANAALADIFNSPENTLKNIRNHYNNHFVNRVKECKKQYEKDETKYKTCATNTIQNTNHYFNTNINTLNAQMSASTCSANTKIDEAFDCHAQHVYQTFSIVGEVNGLVENCLAGHDLCAAHAIDDDDFIKGRCPFQMAWHLEEADIKAANITNPFKGVNSTTPCLQINFITRNFINNVDKV